MSYLLYIGGVMIALVLSLLASAPPPPDMSGNLRLVGRYSIAHACPIGPNIALTNAHVVEVPGDSIMPQFAPAFWSDGLGNSSYLNVVEVDRHEDIAKVTSPAVNFAKWYEFAAAPPKVGEVLYFHGYDWRNRKNAAADRLIDAKVLRVIAEHVLLSEDGGPGSSGSCVLNQAGELVGINAWALNTEGGKVGLAVGVWK